MSIILGSSSPRRREILGYFSLPFKQAFPPFDESTVEFTGDVKSYVEKIATKKATSLVDNYKDQVILCADTIVVCKNKIYTKPDSEKHAFEMLMDLSGSWHEVYTAVCVQKNDLCFSDVEISSILFHPLTEKQIKTYHKHFFFHDKAGGYAIQEGGSIVIKEIKGCYHNIMGLPINATREMLLKVGIDLWDYL